AQLVDRPVLIGSGLAAALADGRPAVARGRVRDARGLLLRGTLLVHAAVHLFVLDAAARHRQLLSARAVSRSGPGATGPSGSRPSNATSGRARRASAR